MLAVACMLTCQLFAQAKPRTHRPVHHAKPELDSWNHNITLDGYLQRRQYGYVNPTFTADREWPHIAAAYNAEYVDTGSRWIGRDFQWGKSLVLAITPVLVGVFGVAYGIAPGFEASVSYKRFSVALSSEYVFNTDSKSLSATHLFTSKVAATGSCRSEQQSVPVKIGAPERSTETKLR